jgi:hypothetical protein
MTPWWDQETAILVGAIGGSAIGVIGGLYGAAMGVLAPRGKCKGLLMSVHVSMIVLGVVALVAGIVAAISGQPYAVYYPLLLGGGLVSLLFSLLLPVVVVRYRQAEARRLDAEQFRRG